MFPVIPKSVENFSFADKPLATKDPVVFYGGPGITVKLKAPQKDSTAP
jgi:hypothetical protein